MAQTLTRILLHVVFSTKNRVDFIRPELEPELYPYIATIAHNKESPVLAIGGTTNHLHLLLSLSKNIALKDLMEVVKKDSSRWLKTKGADLADFHWQDGYAAFSLGESNRKAVTTYIAGQKKKHKRTTFQEELLMFLKKYQVPYDERYIWT
ncbi:MAG: IS200/IS605 family transposase [Phycisphaerae bacterium]